MNIRTSTKQLGLAVIAGSLLFVSLRLTAQSPAPKPQETPVLPTF